MQSCASNSSAAHPAPALGYQGHRRLLYQNGHIDTPRFSSTGHESYSLDPALAFSDTFWPSSNPPPVRSTDRAERWTVRTPIVLLGIRPTESSWSKGYGCNPRLRWLSFLLRVCSVGCSSSYVFSRYGYWAIDYLGKSRLNKGSDSGRYNLFYTPQPTLIVLLKPSSFFSGQGCYVQKENTT